MPSERPEPTFKDILGSIKRIVDEGQGRRNAPPRVLIIVTVVLVALVIAAVAFVKILQQN